ncbi:MAG TPA: carboxypeptidase regulatory-like domain-containing protein [Thermoanaerobaculia bacterium]
MFVCRAAAAQTTGRIEGTVRDGAGAPVPGVTVEATSGSLQGTRAAVSGRDGIFRIPAVPPGSYRLRATLAGFRAVEMTATVSLDATATVDFTLLPSAEEQVLVSGEAPLIDATSTTSGANYTSRIVAKLPVQRNYADIVRATAGVATDNGDTQGRGLALTIYGATSVENQWIIDGVNTTNVIRGFQGKAINNEFVEEVEVKTGGYQAEYGRALGGVINVITKSGGNSYHGDAFAYYDSQATRAASNADNDPLFVSMRIVDYTRTDFGFDLGGYLLKDRLWFFGAYDRVNLPAKVSRTRSNRFVSADERFPLDGTDTLYSGKLTWNVTPETTVVGTVFADPTENSGAGSSDPRQSIFSVRPITNPERSTWDSTRTIGGVDYALRVNRLFGSHALAVLQGSRHEDRFGLVPADGGDEVRTADRTCEGGTLTDPCFPPFFPNSVVGGIGRVEGATNNNRSKRDQARSDVSLYFGPHEVKTGGDWGRSSTTARSYYSGGQRVDHLNEYGVPYYAHSFFATSPTDLTPTDLVASPRTVELSAYLQDSWRAKPGLTVNAGVRWDQEQMLDFQGVTIFTLTGEWSPRLGVVWDPWRDGHTKLQASVGRFYWSFPTDLSVRAYGGGFDITTYNYDPIDLTPDPTVPHHEQPLSFGGTFREPVDTGLKGAYQDELVIGIERLLDPSLSIALRGVYRRLGRTIEDRCDLDYNSPETNFSQCALVNPGGSGWFAGGDVPGLNGLDEPYRSYSDTVAPIGPVRRLYRGIEVTGRKSWGDRAWVQASYVYSSLRGNYTGGVSYAFGQTDPGINGDFDYAALQRNGYGRLALDRPHAFRLDGFWVSPWRVFVGLQAFVESGAPVSRLGYYNGGAYFAFILPRGNDGRYPTVAEANLSLGYPFSIGTVTATVQLNLYNVFNRQTVTARNEFRSFVLPPSGYPDSIFDPNQEQTNPEYGRPTARLDPRLFRAALKISF